MNESYTLPDDCPITKPIPCYWCYICRLPILGDDVEVRHTDEETGEDVHEACCRDCNPICGDCNHDGPDHSDCDGTAYNVHTDQTVPCQCSICYPTKENNHD